MQSIIALWTPRYYGPFNHQGEQPNPDKNQLQTFDWKKVLLQWTLVITRTYSRSRECPQPAEVVYMRSVYRLYFCIERSALIYFSSIFGSFVIRCLFSHSRKHKAKLNCRNMLQMVDTRNFVTKNTGSGNAIRYLHLSTTHLVWHPPPSLKIKKNVHKQCIQIFLKRLKYPGETKNKAMHFWGEGGGGRGEGGQIRCIVAKEVYCGKCANKSIARWRTLTSTARILIKVSPYQCSKTVQNWGQVGIPNQTCGSWTPFFHKNFPFCSNELAIKLLAT